MATDILCEPPVSLPTSSRWYGWYQQRSNTSLLDPALGADNGDDDGTQKLIEIEKQLTVNCLHRGSNIFNARRKFLVAVDSTPASRRALEAVLKQATKDDHVLVAHMWELPIPLEFGAMMWEELPDPTIRLKAEYRNWLLAKETLREYYILLSSSALPSAAYTCVFLPANDHRQRICKLAQEFKVESITLGKHRDSDKKYRRKNWHRKTFRAYVKANAKTHVNIVE